MIAEFLSYLKMNNDVSSPINEIFNKLTIICNHISDTQFNKLLRKQKDIANNLQSTKELLRKLFRFNISKDDELVKYEYIKLEFSYGCIEELSFALIELSTMPISYLRYMMKMKTVDLIWKYPIQIYF